MKDLFENIPTFIGGFRSGTTLLINLLGLHPDIVPWFETKFLCEALRWQRVLAEPKAAHVEAQLMRPETKPFTPENILSALTWDIENTHCRQIGASSDGKAEYEDYPLGGDYVLYSTEQALQVVHDWYRITQTAELEAVVKANRFLIESLARKQLTLSQCRLWVNKTPEIPRFGEELRHCMSRCRIILLIRDGKAVTASVAQLGWWQAEETALYWKKMIEDSRQANKRCPHDYCELRYENLIADPANSLAQIFRFIGVTDKSQEIIKSYEKKVGYPLHRYCGNKFHLDTIQLETFDRIAGDLQSRLGYQ